MTVQKSERAQQPGRRVRIGKVRWTDAEYAMIEARSQVAMVSVSEFVRRAALGKPMTAPVDQRLVGELRRLGALIKQQYPGTATWTPDERRRYWHTRDELLKLARRIERQTGRVTREDAP